MNYPANEIERKWRARWQEEGLFRAPDHPRKKYYVLEMYPYPSGRDLHMGHMKNYVIGDVIARLKRMEGYDVLYPMGWDSFGLPAENAAIQHGVHPEEWAEENIAGYKESLMNLGQSYDWEREIATSRPDYYRWNQWLFLLLLKRGLAYRKGGFVNWCPSCNTVLANEQVIEGKCERCHSPVTKRKLVQWFFRITAYAERLLKDLELLRDGWPPHILKQQEDWIGRSEGTEIIFPVEGKDLRISVFTTRADTLFGVTFMTVAPEWEGLDELISRSPERARVEDYVKEALSRSEIERASTERPKTGVFTGIYALHPFTRERIPVFVGDYVLGGYGTGAVMGVPAHDQRDFEFAKKMGLPIRVVIKPLDGPEPSPETMDRAYEEPGIMVNSGEFSMLSTSEGIRRVSEALARMGLGGQTVAYRLRDWLISRQRYWGTPIPVIHCENCGIVPVPEEDLPVLLPKVEDYIPKGRSPLENSEEFMNTTCPKCKGPAKRDPDTMDTFVDSSWYYLRYPDPKNDKAIFDPAKTNAWLPVDQYIGGAEHATKHLIYARFIHKVLQDEGLVKTPEPFLRLFNQGLVLKRFFWCPVCLRVVPDAEANAHPHPTEEKLEMMSKSRGNTVPISSFTEKYGVDIGRIALLFAGPADKEMEWTEAGAEGARRFINRLWRLYQENPASKEPLPENMDQAERELYSLLQRTIRAVRDDLSRFSFNTAIARLMELVNALYAFEKKGGPVFSKALRDTILLIAPLAPHLAEELWRGWAGETESVFRKNLPEPDERYLVEETVIIPVQVNGKLRARIEVPVSASQDEVLQRALSEENVARYLEGKEPRRVVYVPGRTLNIVV
ncbi:MAG: leucine--tRNA ligase [candidate division WOR-3 bacterium]